jgi:hypothetical protein
MNIKIIEMVAIETETEKWKGRWRSLGLKGMDINELKVS